LSTIVVAICDSAVTKRHTVVCKQIGLSAISHRIFIKILTV